MNKTPALLIAGSAIALTALVGKRASPSPDHLRTAAWYGSLHKAPFTPPGPVFGGAWAVLYPLLGWAGVPSFERPSEQPAQHGDRCLDRQCGRDRSASLPTLQTPQPGSLDCFARGRGWGSRRAGCVCQSRRPDGRVFPGAADAVGGVCRPPQRGNCGAGTEACYAASARACRRQCWR